MKVNTSIGEIEIGKQDYDCCDEDDGTTLLGINGKEYGTLFRNTPLEDETDGDEGSERWFAFGNIPKKLGEVLIEELKGHGYYAEYREGVKFSGEKVQSGEVNPFLGLNEAVIVIWLRTVVRCKECNITWNTGKIHCPACGKPFGKVSK